MGRHSWGCCDGVVVMELDKWMVNGRLIRCVCVDVCTLSVKISEKL